MAPATRRWWYGATAALLLASGCADEPAPHKDRPVDRAARQYAGRMPSLDVPVEPGKPEQGRATTMIAFTTLQGDTQR